MIRLSARELALFGVNGFQAMQKPDELEALLMIVESLAPKVVVEIGVGKGGTAWCWSKFPSVEKLILIDLPGGPWGGGPTKDSVEYIAANTSAKVHFIAGNSLNSETMAAVKATLQDNPIDFLMIDGDHSYEGVRADFDLYEDLVKADGLIAFHDICEHPAETKCDVKRFWDFIKTRYPADRVAEFISEPKNWGGIGVIKT